MLKCGRAEKQRSAAVSVETQDFATLCYTRGKGFSRREIDAGSNPAYFVIRKRKVY